MKINTYLQLTSSLVAIGAGLASPAFAQQATTNGWTGGSSYYYTCNDGSGCWTVGDNTWENSLNWSEGVPTSPQDVNIGLSTFQSTASARPVQHDTVVINTAAQAGQLNIGFPGSRTVTGSAGAGSLTNNGTLDLSRGLLVGAGQGGRGTLINNGSTTLSSGSAIIGNGVFQNNGSLDVQNGSLIIGRTGNSEFWNTAGSTLDVGRNLIVGEETDGLLVSETDINVDGSAILGQQANANGTLVLTEGADLVSGGNLTVGENGTATLEIGVGSLVETDGAVVVGQSGSSRGNTVLVDGAMQNNATLTIGQYGSGAVYVEDGASIDTAGRLSLGAGENGDGLLYNTGEVTNGERLIVGGDGLGVVYTDGAGAVTNTAGNVTVGDDGPGIGLIVVREGTMNNGGRLDIGYEGEGYLSVEDGGQINNSIGVMAREEDARGFAVVTGDGSLWDNRTALVIAQEEGAEAVLVINDGGTVRVADGDGTVVIAADAGSRGVLNIGAVSPVGEDYGLDGRIADLVDGADTDPTPFGAGTLDAAFVQFGNGSGTVNFSHTETEADDYRFGAGFIGLGTVNHYAGFTVLDGDSSSFSGAANVVGGTLVANNVLAGNVTVGDDGIFRIGHGGETGDVVNDILNDGLVQFNRSNVYVFDSVISGTGDVDQIGSGTTVITGENTYTGTTTITDGTLQLGDGGAAGSINATAGVGIGEDGTLAFNRSDNVIFDRSLSGTGQIAQIGSGMTRLTEDNSAFTGLTRVEAGILSVNGVLGGTVDVNGGILEGLGTIGSTTVNGGAAIAPGNGAIGTLTVAGDLLQNAGSTYQAELLSTGETDLLFVNGTAAIDDAAVLNVSKLDDARYDLERRYTVLTAVGGLTGDYTLTGDTFVSTFYHVEDQYDANNAYLKVNQHRLFDEAGATRNQIAAATAAQELKGQVEAIPGYETTGRPTNELFRAIAYLPSDELARYAFDQISGELYASTQIGLLEQSRFVRDATGQRIRNAFGGAGATDEVEERNGLSIWGHGYGSWSEVDGDGNAGTFSNNIGGFLVGADFPVTDMFRLGILGGYSHSSFDASGRGSSASSDNIDLGIYGGGRIDNFGLRIGANHTLHSVSTDRNVVIPGFSDSLSSEYDARTTQVYGDIGYTFDLNGGAFEPFAGLAYVNVDRDGYNETGGVAALSGSGGEVDTTFATLGLRAATSFDAGGRLVEAKGMVGWRHAFNDISPTATHSFAGGTPFTVVGVPLSENVAVIEAGLETALGENATIGASYSGQFGSGLSDHGLRGNFNWKY